MGGQTLSVWSLVCGGSRSFMTHTCPVLLAQLMQEEVCSVVGAAVIKCKCGQVTLNNFSTPEK